MLDEGSEEASWFLYEYYEEQDLQDEAEEWLSLSAGLGYDQALGERQWWIL